jgi:hypothetical protein
MWLDVVDSLDLSWPPGRQLALHGPGLALCIDEASKLVELPVTSDRAQLRIVPEGSGWRLELGRAAWQVLVNGRGAWSGPLVHGDVLRVGHSTLRFVVRPWPGDRQASIEEALALAAPGDARWPVYRDWLLDRGAARGELGEPPTIEDGARWLWSLADLVQKGHLDLGWANGAIRSVTIRKLARRPGPLAWKQAREGLAHVRHVELVSDADTAYRMGPAYLDLLTELAPVLPLLETVSFGVVDGWLPDDTLREAHEALQRAAPRLKTSLEALVVVSRRPGAARLELVAEAREGGLVGVTREEPLVLHPGDALSFRRGPGERFIVQRHAARLREDAVRLQHAPSQGGWHVLAPAHRRGVEIPRLNGRPLAGFRLKHDDLVELVPGVIMRFQLDW